LVHPLSQNELSNIARLPDNYPELEVISFHVASSVADPVLGPDGIYHTDHPPLSPMELIDNASTNVERLRQILPPDISIAVENNNYFPTAAYEHVAIPEFLTRLVRTLKLGMVLDIPHALVSAHNMDTSIVDYLSELPLERIVQIHISRPWLPEALDELAQDTHHAPEQREWDLAKFLLQHCPVRYVTIEYYEDEHRLCACLKDAKEILRGLS
jgi:uncharacterized protein (UPF0276 family)